MARTRKRRGLGDGYLTVTKLTDVADPTQLTESSDLKVEEEVEKKSVGDSKASKVTDSDGPSEKAQSKASSSATEDNNDSKTVGKSFDLDVHERGKLKFMARHKGYSGYGKLLEEEVKAFMANSMVYAEDSLPAIPEGQNVKGGLNWDESFKKTVIDYVELAKFNGFKHITIQGMFRYCVLKIIKDAEDLGYVEMKKKRFNID